MNQSRAVNTMSVLEILVLGAGLGGWAVLSGTLWAATELAGGHPGNPLVWPVRAPADFFGADRHQLLPWHWVDAGSIASVPVFWGSLVAMLALVAIPVVVAWGIRRGSLPPLQFLPNIPQHSRWARVWDYDMQKLIIRDPGQPGRVVLGWKGPVMVATEPGASVLVFGPTQSGKSAGVCVPAILEWTGPVVAISIKRDLLDSTAGWRQRKGRVHVYDPSGHTGIPCMKFSPHFFCLDFDPAWRIANWASSAIDRGKSRGDSDWGHWRDAAQRLIACSWYAGARLGAPMSEVRAWIDDGSGESLRHALSLVPDVDPVAIEVFQSIQQRPERERGSCYSTTQRIMSVFMEKNVAASSETNEFDPDEFLLDGENTLYMCAPMADMDRLQMLFICLVLKIFERCAEVAQSSTTGRIPQPLLAVFDECANTAPIEQLPQYLSTGFSQGITMVTIFQDLSQIRGRYSELTETIVNNSRAKLFLSGIADMQTLQLASQLIGQERYRQHTDTWSEGGAGGGQSTYQYRQMVSPDVARQLRPMSALLVYHYLRPSVLTLRPWFRSSVLRNRATVPFIPGATRVVA
jgi:type IV secretion system protein VirD4